MSDFIKEYWDNQGKMFLDSYKASWDDFYCINLEIDVISRHICSNGKILDVGCANGYSTLRIADICEPQRMVGVDYSESMIKGARENLAKYTPQYSVEFHVADARRLPFNDNSFDAVYTTRTLINLPNWQQQKEALNELVRVCCLGGVVVVSEAFWEPLVRLNAIRTVAGLPPVVEHDFNRYLKESSLSSYLDTRKLIHEWHRFAGLYYLGTRFVREIIEDEHLNGYDTVVHKLFYDLEKSYDGGVFSIQQAVIIKP